MLSKQELEKQIQYHRNRYWVDNDPEITDAEYDALIQNLKTIDPKNKLLTDLEFDYSYTGETIHHPIPLLSLQKVFTFESIQNWMAKVARHSDEEFVISPKYDGISAKFYSKNHTLATRGDGYSGEDITSKLPLLEFEVLNKNNRDSRNITGEIVIKWDEFERSNMKTKSGKKYATPRNLAAGIMNLKNVSHLVGKIQLTFIEHTKYQAFVKYSDFTKDYWAIVVENIKKTGMIYPLDGIVISLKDAKYSDSLGVTSHHPRGKVAFKFEDEFKVSTIKSIVFQSGKRRLTPVANIEPIVINNVTIKRVTLHNAKMILDNDIHIGDQVKVVRSGDVIPYITGVIPGEERKKVVLDTCPNCGSKVQYIEPDLICTNENCSGSTSKLLYESIQVLGIDGIGLTTVEKFIDYLGCQTIVDVLKLTYDDIVNLPDFAAVSASNVIGSIKRATSNLYDYQVLAAINIEGVGVRLAKEICNNYTLNEILEITEFELCNIDHIGYTRACQITDAISKNIDTLHYLIDNTTIRSTTGSIEKSSGKGLICFSGSFPNRKDYYHNLATSSGYRVTDTISKEVNYLVTSGAATTKVSKARKYGITIMRLEDFLKLINDE